MGKEYIERQAAMAALSYNTAGPYDTLHIFEAQDRIESVPAAEVVEDTNGARFEELEE